MNWLLIVVVLTLAAGIVRGYRSGLFMAIFSVASWLILLVFVIAASPKINTYLCENTQISQRIEERCAKEIRQAVMKEVDSQTAEFASDHQITEEGMQKLGFLVPVVLVNNVMESHGTYDTLAQKMTELAMRGISYLIALVVGLIICELLKYLFKGLNKVPLLGKVNRQLGVFVGAIKGLLDVWIAFGFAAIFAGTQWGQFLITYIYESPFLIFLYEHNLLLNTVMYFI